LKFCVKYNTLFDFFISFVKYTIEIYVAYDIEKNEKIN